MIENTKHDKIYIGNLLDFYEFSLTKKQVEYMNLYYQEDYSLQEIAENYGVTRVAIHNQIQNAQRKLLEFESHLQLYTLQSEILPFLEQGYEQHNWEMVQKGIKKIKEVI